MSTTGPRLGINVQSILRALMLSFVLLTVAVLSPAQSLLGAGDSESTPSNENLQYAVQMYNALAEIGILYQQDPVSPFNRVQGDPRAVDSINLPRDTLKRITGDVFDYTPLNLELVGDYAVFAADLNNVHVIPPWYVSLPGGNAPGVDVLGNYAFITTAQSQLNVVDLSWQDNLNKVGSVATQGNTSYQAVDVAVTRDYTFVADETNVLYAYDLMQ